MNHFNDIRQKMKIIEKSANVKFKKKQLTDRQINFLGSLFWCTGTIQMGESIKTFYLKLFEEGKK